MSPLWADSRKKMIESPFKCERPIHSLADSSDALTAASVLWEVTISPHSSIWRLRCLHTLQFGGYGVSTLFNLEVTVSPHSQLGVLSSYGELRDGFPPTFDLLNRCFVICFFVSSKGHELDLFSIGSSRFESFLLLG